MYYWPSAYPRMRRSHRRRPSGMTMVELLIVISVMTILIGVALPVMKTSLESSRLREATRMLNTQFAVARAVTVETGRPAGVWFEVESITGTAPPVVYASRAFIAETPAPYCGDLVEATMKVNNPANYTATYDDGTTNLDDGYSANLPNLVQANDLIRFGYRGPFYRITSINTTTPNKTITFALGEYDPLPPTATLPYQILRQPKKSSAPPVELPRGTVVDLMMSGYGLAGLECAGVSGQLCILFGASGEVSKVLTPTTTVYPTQTLHLLVGSIEKCSGATPSENLQDNANLWVSIAPQTGRVTTAENYWTAGGTIATAREFAQSSQAKGGR